MKDEIRERFDCTKCQHWNINCTCKKVCESGSEYILKKKYESDDRFEKEWRRYDGDNYPFGVKKLCFLFFESRDEELQRLEEENKKLKEALNGCYAEVKNCTSIRCECVKNIVKQALQESE
jgi:hypothetical protein